MDKKESSDIIISCNKKFNLWFAIALIISLLILFLNINIIAKILFSFLFFFIAVGITSTVIKSKYINPILHNELNPQKYYTVICGTHNTTKQAIDEMIVAYFMCDYNAVINICNLKLEDNKTRNYKYPFLQYLARAYFDLGDYENLKATCERFESELSKIKNLKSANKIRNAFGNPIKYYESYLSGDFKACKQQYKQLIDDANILKSKLAKIAAYYLYAVACYKLGEFEEAKTYFSIIVNEAPLLCYCETAKNYIYAIDNNQEFTLEKQSIKIEPNYEIPQGKTVKTDKVGAIIGIIAIILIAVIICTVSVKNAPSTPEKVLKNTQGMTQLIISKNIDKDNLLCLYDTKNNGCSVSILEHIGENKYKARNTMDDISVDYIYEMGTCKTGKVIEFSLYEERYEVPNHNYMVEEIFRNGDTKYFCITNIRKEKFVFISTKTLK